MLHREVGESEKDTKLLNTLSGQYEIKLLNSKVAVNMHGN